MSILSELSERVPGRAFGPGSTEYDDGRTVFYGPGADPHEVAVVHLDLVELGVVDDGAVGGGQAAVSAAAHGDGQVRVDGGADGGRDLLGGGGAEHDLGIAGAVEDGASVVVFGGAGSECPAGNAFAQLREDRHEGQSGSGLRHPSPVLAAREQRIPANPPTSPARACGYSTLGCAFARSITHAYANARSRQAE